MVEKLKRWEYYIQLVTEDHISNSAEQKPLKRVNSFDDMRKFMEKP
jgi:hypothetical protein